MKFLAVCSKFALAGLAVGVLSAQAALAQVPSYARGSGEQSIAGRVISINGTWNISVRDDNGYIDSVELHQGTIINPTGLTLGPGMRVMILGYNAGSVFEANEIDTPYHAVAVPVPVYYGPGWWYPGYAYGYGPSFSLRISTGPGLVRAPFAHPQPFYEHRMARPYAGHEYQGHH